MAEHLPGSPDEVAVAVFTILKIFILLLESAYLPKPLLKIKTSELGSPLSLHD